MKNIGLNSFTAGDDYIKFNEGEIEIIFSTAENGKNFNRNTKEGIKELESLALLFNCKRVKYLNQIHSNKVFTYKVEEKEFTDYEGDAVITNEKKSIIGVFTADCVPIILVDKVNKAIAAIHSGWKGTFNSKTKKTIEKMIQEYEVKIEDIKVYIGPHIRQCCYEVSEELKEEFLNKTKIKEDELFDGRNLSMERCILEDLRSINIEEDNIYTINLCTYCEDKIKLFSYRKSVGTYGR